MVLAWQPGRRGPPYPPQNTFSHTHTYIHIQKKTHEDLNDTSYLYTNTLILTNMYKDKTTSCFHLNTYTAHDALAFRVGIKAK